MPLDPPTIARLAAVLLHFAWQGLAIALVGWALMTLVRRPTIRYAIGCAGLAAMIAAPLVTFALLAPRTTSPGTTRTTAVVFTDAVARPVLLPSITHGPPPVAATPTWRERFAALAPYGVSAWLVGVALLGLRHAVGLAGIHRLRRHAIAIDDAALRDRLARLAARLHLRRPVALLSTLELDAPAVIGLLRPAILWPAAIIAGLSPAQLDGLLAHELAHIRRHDYLVNLLQVAIETLGFYHPAVWWLSRRVRQEREHCCDDIAAGVVGDRATYAAALVTLETQRHDSTFALSSNGGSLMTRIRRLLTPKPSAVERRRRRPRVPMLGFTLGVVALGLLLSFAWRAAAQDRGAATKPTTIASRPAIEERAQLFVGKDGAVTLAVNQLTHHRAALAQAERTQASSDAFPADVVRALVGGIETTLARRLDELDVDPKAAVARGGAAGTYYMGGHVQRAGAYTFSGLAGGSIRLKQALIAAGLEETGVGGAPINEAWLGVTTRIEGSDKQYTIDFPMADVLSGKLDLPVLPQDAIMVGVRAPTSATQAAGAPPTDGRRIAANDLLECTLSGIAGPDTITLDRRRVDAAGAIKLPFAGTVVVIKLTTDEAVTKVNDALAKSGHPSTSTTMTFVEETPASATKPTAAAPAAPAADYAIAPGDLLRITVGDLTGAGLESALIKRVANSGIITMPYLGEIKLVGSSEAQAEKVLQHQYAERQILSNAVISVLVVQGSDGQHVPLELLGGTGAAAATSQQLADLAKELADAKAAVRNATTLPAAIDQAEKAASSPNRFSPIERLHRLQSDRAEMITAIEKLKAQGNDDDPELGVRRVELRQTDIEINQLAGLNGNVTVLGVQLPMSSMSADGKPTLRQALVSNGNTESSVRDVATIHVHRRLPEESADRDYYFSKTDVFKGKDGDFRMMANDEIDGAADPNAQAKLAADPDEGVDSRNDTALAAREPLFARLLSAREAFKTEIRRLEPLQGVNAPTMLRLQEQLGNTRQAIAKMRIGLAASFPAATPTTIPQNR